LPFAEKDPNLCSHRLFPLAVFYLLAELPVIVDLFFFFSGGANYTKFDAFHYTFSYVPWIRFFEIYVAFQGLGFNYTSLFTLIPPSECFAKYKVAHPHLQGMCALIL